MVTTVAPPQSRDSKPRTFPKLTAFGHDVETTPDALGELRRSDDIAGVEIVRLQQKGYGLIVNH
jgi:hypothetical protein